MSMGNIPILHHRRFFLSLFLILSWSNHFIDLVGAATTTIDDAASPAFTFISTWNAITPSDPCIGCAAQLQSNLTFDGTWHDGSVAGYTGSLFFDGTGVTLYGIANGELTCALTFVLDGGSPVDLDLSSVPSSPAMVYNYPFFTSSGLSSGSHTLSWTIETSVDNAVALIDYAVVTSDEPTSTSSSSSASPTTSIGGSPTVTVAQTDPSSSTTTPPSSAPPSSPSSSSSSALSSISSSSSGAASSTATGTSTDSSSGSGSMLVTTAPTSPASSSAVVITIGTSVSTSMVLSSTSTTSSGLVTALGTKKSKTVIVVGAVVGGTIGLLLSAAIFFLLIRRKRRQMPPSATPGIEAFRYYRHLEGESRAEICPPAPEMTRRVPLSRDVSIGPSKVSISRLPSTNRSPPPLPHMNMDESRTNPTPGMGSGLDSSINGSTAQPITGAEPSVISAPIQQMEQRILNLERMLRQADQAEILLPDTSPPPYLSQ